MPDSSLSRRVSGSTLRRWAGFALAGLAMALCGCPPKAAELTWRDARPVLDRINASVGVGEVAVRDKSAVVSLAFRDDNGTLRRFLGHPATLVFRAPRCLYFDIKSAVAPGSLAHFGSNEERFWIWVDVPDERKLWWGYWADLNDQNRDEFAVPPDELLNALCLRDLPTALEPGLTPLLMEFGGRQRLLYMAHNADGWLYVAREVLLEPSGARPAEILERDATGKLRMHAWVSAFRAVEGGQGFVPGRLVVKWPQDDGEVRLDLNGPAVFDKDVDICEFPSGWQGDVEQLGKGAKLSLRVDAASRQDGSSTSGE